MCHEINGKFIANEWVGWASSYLSQAGCLVRPKRGYMAPGKNAKDFLNFDRPITVAYITRQVNGKPLEQQKYKLVIMKLILLIN